MAFRPTSSASKGGWINPAGAQAFRDLAQPYAGMEDRVENQALAAADTHLVQPAIEAGAHPSVQAFTHGDSLYIGVHPAHPDAEAVADREYGTPTQKAGAQIRQVLARNGETSFDAFQQGLTE